MCVPVQHHYLPQNSCLKFFESADKKGFIWMYQRGKDTILVSKHNAAKERHLYSFTEKDGSKNTQIEIAFAELEKGVAPTLEQMSTAQGPVSITAQQKVDLSYYLAIQAVRTPAFRSLLKKQSEEFARIQTQALASNPAALRRALSEIQKKRPEISAISAEEMSEFILGGDYTIEASGEDYFLKQSLQLADHLYPAIAMKDFNLIRTTSNNLITSDHPVQLIPNPNMPRFYGGGFLHSDIFIPISSSVGLLCQNPTTHTTSPDSDHTLGYKILDADQVDYLNSLTIYGAERFLFSASSDPEIQTKFDQTTTPTRVHFSSPFTNLRKDDK